MLTLMAALLAAEAVSAEPKAVPDIAWASATAEQDRFWIRSAEISSQYYPATVTVWVHGEHGGNSRAAYKSSLQRIRFFCDGTLQLVALTTTDSAGRKTEWQGAGSVDRISQGTVYQNMERKLCTGDLAAK